MKPILIRREMPGDYREVENLTREAFWNVYRPGCDEHYIVHILRNHEDFIPELDLVMEKEGRIIGHILYMRARRSGDVVWADQHRAGRAAQGLWQGPAR